CPGFPRGVWIGNPAPCERSWRNALEEPWSLRLRGRFDVNVFMDLEVAPLQLGQKGGNVIVLFWSPDAGFALFRQQQLYADRKAHRRAGIDKTIERRMRMADHSEIARGLLPSARAATDREMNFVALLCRNAMTIGGNVARDHGFEELGR